MSAPCQIVSGFLTGKSDRGALVRPTQKATISVDARRHRNGDREDHQMSATDFAGSLEELVESAAARAVAQVLARNEQDSARSPWYTSEEAAEYTRLSLNAVKQARRRGQLRFDRSANSRPDSHMPPQWSGIRPAQWQPAGSD